MQVAPGASLEVSPVDVHSVCAVGGNARTVPGPTTRNDRDGPTGPVSWTKPQPVVTRIHCTIRDWTRSWLHPSSQSACIPYAVLVGCCMFESRYAPVPALVRYVTLRVIFGMCWG